MYLVEVSAGVKPSLDHVPPATAKFHTDPYDVTFLEVAAFWPDVQPFPGGATTPRASVVFVPQHRPFQMLNVIMQILLGPFGCPWDREQTHHSLMQYLLNETYEVLEAIQAGNKEHLKVELGDLLLQPVFHSQLAQLSGDFLADTPIRSICSKLIHRHPHVFGNAEVNGSEEVLKNWDAIKQKEGSAHNSLLQGVPKAMPALARALEVSIRAARVGFEWPNYDQLRAKLHEELEELEQAINSQVPDQIQSELGDVLFTVVNIARFHKIDAEEALRTMINRFQARFEYIEAHANQPLTELSAERWDALWNAAKAVL